MKHAPRLDASTRILRAAGNAEELDKILQDECRRRAAKKLAATLVSPDFRFPTALSAEQATSDDVADIHARMVNLGDTVVDLTCGLGIDAFHIATRAKSVLAIDLDPTVAACIEPNARALGLENVTALNADCITWLAETAQTFDVAFIDPARRAQGGGRLFSLADCKPNVIEALPSIRRIAKRLIIKMSPMLDIVHTLAELPETERLHVIGTTMECKELVAEINFMQTVSEPEIIVNTINAPTLSFRLSESHTPETFATNISPGQIIGEPWPTIAKAAPRGLLPGVQLHPSTLLWVDAPENFPGKRYKVTAVEDFSSSTLKRLARQKIAASVAVKNFPLTAEALRSRLKTTESATQRIIATTLHPSRRLLLTLQRL